MVSYKTLLLKENGWREYVNTRTGDTLPVEIRQLINKIEELKLKLKNIGEFDEAKTKHAIVLPLLHLLGWNVYDVEEVVPEYSVSGRRVDYSLVTSSNKVFIEVKKPTEDLEKHQEQLLIYAFREGVKLAILTNGITWFFFLPAKLEERWEQRKFFTIDILRQDAEESAQGFVDFLSKENVKSGTAIKKAEELLESQKRQEKIRETLPKAWNELISEPDERLVELLIDKTEKMCGYRPAVGEVVEFLEKLINKKQVLPPKPIRTKIKPTESKLERISVSGEKVQNAIIKVLGDLGGQASVRTILSRVKKEVNEFDSPFWLGYDNSGHIRWEHRVHTEKAKLKERGLIKEPKESGRGIWELTEKGWEEYYETIK